ncbi:MAG: hypothetical protein JXB48_21035 [Candidatus Latescibacteria bacterium]|nr:hypothetical protein [Candidatus Latescibacterota bacterium]
MVTTLFKNKKLIPAYCIALLLSVLFPLTGHAEIICDGHYGGHLQGIATDGKSIYWSFTVELVKTDMNGKIIKNVNGPSHHGDIVYHTGKVYVAVNLGLFNQEPGKADSWVYVYDADNLTLLTKHDVQEVVHGAGGITYYNEHFYVVGGLPDSYKENYVYKYDKDFRFIERHVVKSGHTQLGIQTACFALGSFWFGCYGYPENSALLKVDAALKQVEWLDTHTSVGIDFLDADRFLQGFTGKDNDTGKYWGKARIIRFDNSRRGRFIGMD